LRHGLRLLAAKLIARGFCRPKHRSFIVFRVSFE
jgi:hypothetical protein